MPTPSIGDTIKVTVQKYDPSRDDVPHYQSYSVPYAKEMRILESLDYIVEELGQSLAYHWFCGVKKCGMCGVVVNGRPVLACFEPVESEMIIEPLPQFPVIRDLVVDRDQYTSRLLAIDPFLDRAESYPGFPEPLTSTQMEKVAEMAHCIECMLCDSMCPSYGDDFVGPATLVQLARWAFDPRERPGKRRSELALNIGRLDQCVSCYQCSQACPSNIPILEWAIDGLRKQVIENELGLISSHNRVVKELILEQGIINPSFLLLRSKGLKALTDLPLAIRLWSRGRLSLRKMLRSIFRNDQLNTQDEVIALSEAIKQVVYEVEQR